MLIAREIIIGRRIKSYVSNGPLSYMIHDEGLFNDPPPKDDCPICFLPMPEELIACISLPPATLSSVPIYEYAKANEKLAGEHAETYIHVAENVFAKDAWTPQNVWKR